jgi:hypothetical protein
VHDFDCRAEVQCFPDPARPDLLFELAWREGGTERDPLSPAIPIRRTNRKFFNGPALSEAQLEQLAMETGAFGGVRLQWFHGAHAPNGLLQAIRLAEAERFARRLLHDELFGAIQWEAGWRKSCDEGLPPGALEVEPPLRPFFKAMRHWRVMQSLNSVGMHRVLGVRAAYLPARLSPHLGVLTTRGTGAGEAIETGRAFQRLWLRATLLDKALQPLAACAALIRQQPEEGWVSAATQSRLSEDLEKLFPGEKVAMIFRRGSASNGQVRAGRRSPRTYMRPSGA